MELLIYEVGKASGICVCPPRPYLSYHAILASCIPINHGTMSLPWGPRFAGPVSGRRWSSHEAHQIKTYDNRESVGFTVTDELE